MKKTTRFLFVIILLSSLFVLSGCQNQTDLPTNTPDEPTVELVSTDTPEPIIPTNTPEPTKLFFYTNGSQNTTLINDIQSYLNEYAVANGYILEPADTYDPGVAKVNDIVVSINVNGDFSQFAVGDQAPATIVFTNEVDPARTDLHQIKLLSAEEIFLSGYIGALVTDDWRLGGILPNTAVKSTNYTQIFENGGHYLCGRCTPVYAPLVVFPQTTSITSQAEVINAYAQLETNRIYALYVQEAFITDELISNLRQNSRLILSNARTPGIRELTDINIYQDYTTPLTNVLMNLAKIGSIQSTKLTVEDNAGLLSTGKLNYLQELIDNLEQGFVSPLSGPAN